MALNLFSTAITISDESRVGEARRAATAMAAESGMSETEAGRVAIATTEAASNVLKHAGGGEILLRPLDSGMELLAVDKGPGISNLAEAMEDWNSTAGTAGIGLGSIARQASFFDIYTGGGLGTVVMALFHPAGYGPSKRLNAELEIGCVQVPYPGERACGDAWTRSGLTIFAADGLGHGHQADQAAQMALATFRANASRPVHDIVAAIHNALHSTRGAAVAIASIDYYRRSVSFCGLGNINGVILSKDARRSMMSHNGTAGHEVHRIVPLEYAWPDDALLILHTDGLSAKWDLNSYPGLAVRHPALIAGVLHRDFRRRTDDSTIVAARLCHPDLGGRS